MSFDKMITNSGRTEELRSHAIVARLVQIRNEFRELVGEPAYRLFGVASTPGMALDESATGVADSRAGFRALREGEAAR
jgi:hypothetical protein